MRNMEQELKDVQRSEAGKTVKAGPGKGGKLSQLVELARARMDELRNHLISTRGELESNRDRLKQLEGLLATFKEEYNPNFNDEGVKRAVRAWEDYAASHTLGQEPNAAAERDIAELIKEDSENGLDWEEYVEDESDTEGCKCLPSPPPVFNPFSLSLIFLTRFHSILLHRLPPIFPPHIHRRKPPQSPPNPHRQRHPRQQYLRHRNQKSHCSSRTSQSGRESTRGCAKIPHRTFRRPRQRLWPGRSLPRPQRYLRQQRFRRIYVRILLPGPHESEIEKGRWSDEYGILHENRNHLCR